jgi:phosphomethylpyrimidine synthase
MNENKESKELTTDEIKFPNSTKIYVTTNGDTRNDAKVELNVPFREIALSPTRNMQDELEENLPVRVYDTSGVYTDERVICDVREGLPTLRRDWIIARGDVEEYVGREILPQDNGYFDERCGRFR